MNGQLSFEDCFTTRNRLRAEFGLVALYPCLDRVIPSSEIEQEKEMCRYWVYYNNSCQRGIAPKSMSEWRKQVS